jgi:5'-3' exonuclease
MAQPVRKIIAEAHPEIAEKPIYTLLVDGTNVLKICEVASRVNTRGEEYGAFFTFLVKMKALLKKKDFDYVYVVFDDDNSGIMRYRLYNEYKANRDKNYETFIDGESDYVKAYNENLRKMRASIFGKKAKKEKTPEEIKKKEDFARQRHMLMKYFEELFIRCICDHDTEGDDIMAYYVMNKKPNEKVVIVSGDMDLTQLLAPDVCIFNPRTNSFVTYENFKSLNGYPSENVLIKKIFCGDLSDNIGNIDGLSEAKLFDMMPEMKDRPVTVEEVKNRAKLLNEERVNNKKKPLKVLENVVNGVSRRNYEGDFYEINEKIINLRKPLLTNSAIEELNSMRYAPIDPEGRSFGNVAVYVTEDDITELLDSNKFSNFFVEFNALAHREKTKFDKECGRK